MRTLLAVALTVLCLGGLAFASGSLISGGSATLSPGTVTPNVTVVSPLYNDGGSLGCIPASALAGGCLTYTAGRLVADAGIVTISVEGIRSAGPLRLGDASNPASIISTGGVTGDLLAVGTAGAFVGALQLSGMTSDTGAADVAISLNNKNALGVADFSLQIMNGNSFSSTAVMKVYTTGAIQQGVPTDQSADCDNAATGNGASGKICIQAGVGSMTLTNSAVTANSLVFVTNVSADTTCLSGYATVAPGSVVIGCVGAATATANTVMSFHLLSL